MTPTPTDVIVLKGGGRVLARDVRETRSGAIHALVPIWRLVDLDEQTAIRRQIGWRPKTYPARRIHHVERVEAVGL